MNNKISKSILAALLVLSLPVLVFADVAADFAQARQSMAKSNYAQANFYFFKILASQPNNIEAQYGLAQSFSNQQDYPRVRVELDKLFALNSRHQEGLLLSAMLNLLDKNYASALQDAQQVIQQNPDSVQAYKFMSSAYAGLDDEPSAKKAMDRALQLSATQK